MSEWEGEIVCILILISREIELAEFIKNFIKKLTFTVKWIRARTSERKPGGEIPALPARWWWLDYWTAAKLVNIFRGPHVRLDDQYPHYETSYHSHEFRIATIPGLNPNSKYYWPVGIGPLTYIGYNTGLLKFYWSDKFFLSIIRIDIAWNSLTTFIYIYLFSFTSKTFGDILKGKHVNKNVRRIGVDVYWPCRTSWGLYFTDPKLF